MISQRHRPLLFLGIGTVLAALLVGVLFISVGTPGSATPPVEDQVTAANLQPGINAPTGLLLSLTVFPKGQRPLAPDFHLTDQHGEPVSMDRFRGQVVVFSANDDECTDLCTLLANDVVQADRDLGRSAKDVQWLSVNANPFYPQVSAVRSWSDQHGLGRTANWRFGTAAPKVLRSTWKKYGIEVQADAKTRTVDHSTELFFVDPSGHERAVAEFGAASADTALYAHGLAQMADDLLPPGQQTHVAGPETPAPTRGNATIGATAPDFSLPYLQGGHGTYSLRRDRGRYVVVDFWSSTCTVCRVDLPHLEASYRYAGKRVDFVGVDVSDPSPPAARALAHATGLTFPVVADRDGRAAGGEQITGLPFTVVIGPKGKVVIRHPGELTTEQLDYVLQGYVNDLPAS